MKCSAHFMSVFFFYYIWAKTSQKATFCMQICLTLKTNLHLLESELLFDMTTNLIQPTISLEMPVPSQGDCGFPSFPVVD